MHCLGVGEACCGSVDIPQMLFSVCTKSFAFIFLRAHSLEMLSNFPINLSSDVMLKSGILVFIWFGVARWQSSSHAWTPYLNQNEIHQPLQLSPFVAL